MDSQQTVNEMDRSVWNFHMIAMLLSQLAKKKKSILKKQVLKLYLHDHNSIYWKKLEMMTYLKIPHLKIKIQLWQFYKLVPFPHCWGAGRKLKLQQCLHLRLTHTVHQHNHLATAFVLNCDKTKQSKQTKHLYTKASLCRLQESSHLFGLDEYLFTSMFFLVHFSSFKKFIMGTFWET